MNVKTLVLCFFTAFIFWLLNSLNKSGYSTKISYPLEIKYNDSLYISTKPLPNKIEVNISSSGWELLKNSFISTISPIVYEINNPLTINKLDDKYLLETLSVDLKKTKLNYVITDTSVLHFEKRQTKAIQLKVDSLAIDLDKNFVVASPINISPSTIILEGPESVLKKIDNKIIIKVPAKGLATNFDERIKIPLPQNTLVKANADKALISFEVAELLK